MFMISSECNFNRNTRTSCEICSKLTTEATKYILSEKWPAEATIEFKVFLLKLGRHFWLSYLCLRKVIWNYENLVITKSCFDLELFAKIKKTWILHTNRNRFFTFFICARVSFLIKLLGSACNFIKKDTLAHVFSCEFCESLQLY